jgi:hypothetical protein
MKGCLNFTHMQGIINDVDQDNWIIGGDKVGGD